MISAKVIKDSISTGDRLTTMEVVCHRFVLAEFNTHRAFSRNSASSRAIPLHKQIKKLQDEPAVPMVWATEKPGMSGGDQLEDTQYAEILWRRASRDAVQAAQNLADLGVHKSICNRLLEPFMWHTIIVSATDWDGFWRQRCSPLAQPEMRLCAEAMKAAYDASVPILLKQGEWHLPYIGDSDRAEAASSEYTTRESDLLSISAARCARVSYLTHDGVRDTLKDIELYNKLASADPPHASPLEHVATPSDPDASRWSSPGNFTGWRQLRHDVFPDF